MCNWSEYQIVWRSCTANIQHSRNWQHFECLRAFTQIKNILVVHLLEFKMYKQRDHGEQQATVPELNTPANVV